jgi:hypothetical protein
MAVAAKMLARAIEYFILNCVAKTEREAAGATVMELSQLVSEIGEMGESWRRRTSFDVGG